MTISSLVLTDSQLLNSAKELASKDSKLINSAAIHYLIQESLPTGKAVLPTQLSQADFQPVLEAVFKEFVEGKSPAEELILPVGLENGDLAALYLRKDANGKPQVTYIDPTGLDISPDSFDDTFTKGNALKYSTLPACIATAVEQGLGTPRQDIIITTNKVRRSSYQDGVRYVDTRTDDSAVFTVHVVAEITNGRYNIEVDEAGKGHVVCESADGNSISIDSLKLNAENLRQGQLGRLKQDFQEQFPDRAEEIDSIKIEKPEISKDKKPKIRKAEKTSEEESTVKSTNPLSFPELLRRGLATVFALANLPAAAGIGSLKGTGSDLQQPNRIGSITIDSYSLPEESAASDIYKETSGINLRQSGFKNTQNFPEAPIPSQTPTPIPSMQPTLRPTAPTRQPTLRPTAPTSQPTGQPTLRPTAPTGQPTLRPTAPTNQPTGQPTLRPTAPTNQPTVQPSLQPTAQPSLRPTGQPSLRPTGQPTKQPTSQPTGMPSGNINSTAVDTQQKQKFIETIIYAAGGTFLGAATEAAALTFAQGSFGGLLYRLWEDGVLPGLAGSLAVPAVSTGVGAIAGAAIEKPQEHNQKTLQETSSPSGQPTSQPTFQEYNTTSANISSHSNYLASQEIRTAGIHTRVDDDQNTYSGTKSVPHGAENPTNPTYVAEGALNGVVGGAAFIAGICFTTLVATYCCSRDKERKTHPSNAPAYANISDLNIQIGGLRGATSGHNI